MLYYDCKDSELLRWKLKALWLFLFSLSIMVCVGDWQIQIIFTKKNQCMIEKKFYVNSQTFTREVLNKKE